MPDQPGAEEAFFELHERGRSIGEVALAGTSGIAWLVTGHRGDRAIRGEAPSRDDAWREALRRARAMDLDPAPRNGQPRAAD